MKQQVLFKTSQEGADFSPCRNYRYSLWRIWDKSKPLVMFIGLNPSTANETHADPTIESVIRISKFNGFGGFYMMNCWPFVASKPELLKSNNLTDEWNNNMITVLSSKCQTVVFAWGNFKIVRDSGRDIELQEMFKYAKCIGVNNNGSPKHPLFQKGTSKLIDFPYSL